MQDLEQMIEIAQKLTEYVKSRPSVKATSIVFLTAFTLFNITSLPAIYSILKPMNDTIRAWIFFVMLASGVYIASVALVNFAEYLYDKRKLEKERLRKETDTKKQLDNLGVAERRILKYMLNHSGNVWLPADNINVLSLYTQKILYPMTGLSVHRGDIYKGCQCFAYRLSEDIRDYMNEKETLETPDWKSIPDTEEMKIYQ